VFHVDKFGVSNWNLDVTRTLSPLVPAYFEKKTNTKVGVLMYSELMTNVDSDIVKLLFCPVLLVSKANLIIILERYELSVPKVDSSAEITLVLMRNHSSMHGVGWVPETAVLVYHRFGMSVETNTINNNNQQPINWLTAPTWGSNCEKKRKKHRTMRSKYDDDKSF
jgi:hypothetical protein